MIQKSFDLSERTVIVTGGAGLLGREFCRSLAEAGAQVVVSDLRGDAAQELAREISAAGGARAIGVETDVTRKESVLAMVGRTLDSFGRIDGLVNNAALDPKFRQVDPEVPVNAFEDYPLEAWQQGVDVNLTGCFLCAQAVASTMQQQGEGAIVNICSTYGLVGPDQRIYTRGRGGSSFYKPVVYSVTKSALLGLTRYLATYWSGTRIRVNALSPGGVYDDNDPAFVENYSYRTPLARMANRGEYSAALIFLLSSASSYMTGANLVIDGGWTAW